MAAINCDDPEARCADGNLFRLNAENASLTVEGLVNGQSTGALPHGERMILPNTLDGTTNTLAVKLNGTTHNICSLDDMNITRPQDVGVLISEVPQGAPTTGGATEQDMLVLEVPGPLVAAAPPEGEIDIDGAPNGVLMWAALSILATLEVIDEATGMQALFADTDGYVDLRMTGTDGAPALADMAAAAASRNGRAALRAILDGGRGALNVAQNAAGNLIIVARMKAGIARQLGVGIAAALARSRLSVVVAGTRGQLGAPAAAAQAGSRIPVVGFVIVGTINFLQWYEDPTSRGDWQRLFSMMVVDGTALVISAAVANAAAGMAIGALAVAGTLTVGAAVVVAGVAIVAGLIAGAIVTAVARHFDLENKFYGMMSAVGRGLNSVAQGATEITGRFADTLGEIVEDYRQMGEDIQREWNSGWGQIRRNLMSGRPSGLF
ncbi:hypothetical protein [uncultured Tateyamaria sp.]|uniref:hypothetical protein n=1 Tax=Tateyamaria sp. 1078 TaxID=3417464 RepID=UPI0026379F01|nr:hypothetical protein [uncultured Tateyamaria sp.]